MKTYAFLLKYAMWALPLACVAMLSSCYNDEYDDCPTTNNDPVPVTVKVSAGAIGDLNGTRVGDDPNAEEHEFINTLHVYVVSHEENNVRRTLMELNTDGLADNALAQEGNLTDWTSETFTLAPGTYTFYAFANIDNYEGQYGDELSPVMGGQFLGDQFIIDDYFTDDNLNSYRLLDPAAEINFGERKYIPMSAVGTVTVNGDLNASGGIIVDLPLERLVSKVRLTVGYNVDIANYADASVTFAGYSHNVPLMAGLTGSDYGGRNNDVTKSLKDLTADNRTVSFYVNETPEGNPFTVTLETGSTTGVSVYQATTELYNYIPRNSIYPLILTFDESGIVLEPKAYIQGLGVPAYEVEYDVDEDGTYIFGITSGSYLTIEPTINNAEGTPTFTWNVDQNNPTGMREGEEDDINIAYKSGVPELSAGGSLWIISADDNIKNYEYVLTLNAQWASGGNNYNRTYNVIVRISQDYNTVLNGIIDNLGLSANTRGAVTTLSPERLNMIKIK